MENVNSFKRAVERSNKDFKNYDSSKYLAYFNNDNCFYEKYSCFTSYYGIQDLMMRIDDEELKREMVAVLFMNSECLFCGNYLLNNELSSIALRYVELVAENKIVDNIDSFSKVLFSHPLLVKKLIDMVINFDEDLYVHPNINSTFNNIDIKMYNILENVINSLKQPIKRDKVMQKKMGKLN